MVSSFISKLTRRKQISSDDDVLQTRLKRCLSTLDICLIGIGHMMGSGIYVVSPTVARKAGPASVLSFIIAGFASMLAALAYAEFGVRYPRAGSAYSYIYFSVGEFLAFIVGWNVLLENTLAMAAVTQSCAVYIGVAGVRDIVQIVADSLVNGAITRFIATNIGNLTHYENATHGVNSTNVSFFNETPQLSVIVIMAIFVIILMLGTSGTSKIGNILCGINISVLVLILGIGAAKGDIDNWTSEKTGGFLPKGWKGVFNAASMCFFSFGGFDAISATAEEARNPRKSMPIATIVAMSTVTVLYTGVVASLTLLRNWTEILDLNGFAEAMHYNGVDWAKYLITIGAMCGMSTVAVVTLYTVVRAALSMAEDGLLFKFFAIISRRSQVPEYSMFLFAAIATTIAVFFNIDTIIDMLSIGTLMAYMMVTCGLVAHRYAGAQSPPLALRYRNIELLLRNYLSQKQYIFLCLVVIIIFSFVSSFSIQLAFNGNLVVAGLAGSIIFIASAFLALLKEAPEELNNYKMPMMPWLAVASVIVDCVLMSTLSWITWIRLVVWLVLGCTLYATYGFSHSKLAERYNAL